MSAWSDSKSRCGIGSAPQAADANISQPTTNLDHFGQSICIDPRSNVKHRSY
jgi:hypothetical protein